MSEPNIGGGCHECGGQYDHKEFCSKNTPTPVYDLAEFELRLEGWVAGANGCRNDSESALAVEIVLGLLKASKRGSK